MTQPSTILWRRLDHPGYESARVFFDNTVWNLTGTAVFAYDQQPCRLDYQVLCNAAWHSISGRVAGWIGAQTIEVAASVDSAGSWWVNGTEYPEAAGCIDLDLNFSPSTNLFPIRRLNLAVGQTATVKAAWLRFPDFTLEPLEQVYRRVDEGIYHYESGGGSFVAELSVNKAGFVTRYGDLWQAEATST